MTAQFTNALGTTRSPSSTDRIPGSTRNATGAPTSPSGGRNGQGVGHCRPRGIRLRAVARDFSVWGGAFTPTDGERQSF